MFAGQVLSLLLMGQKTSTCLNSGTGKACPIDFLPSPEIVPRAAPQAGRSPSAKARPSLSQQEVSSNKVSTGHVRQVHTEQPSVCVCGGGILPVWSGEGPGLHCDPWLCSRHFVSGLWLPGAIMTARAEVGMEGGAGLAGMHCDTCDITAPLSQRGQLATGAAGNAGPVQPGRAASVHAHRRPC